MELLRAWLQWRMWWRHILGIEIVDELDSVAGHEGGSPAEMAPEEKKKTAKKRKSRKLHCQTALILFKLMFLGGICPQIK